MPSRPLRSRLAAHRSRVLRSLLPQSRCRALRSRGQLSQPPPSRPRSRLATPPSRVAARRSRARRSLPLPSPRRNRALRNPQLPSPQRRSRPRRQTARTRALCRARCPSRGARVWQTTRFLPIQVAGSVHRAQAEDALARAKVVRGRAKVARARVVRGKAAAPVRLRLTCRQARPRHRCRPRQRLRVVADAAAPVAVVAVAAGWTEPRRLRRSGWRRLPGSRRSSRRHRRCFWPSGWSTRQAS